MARGYGSDYRSGGNGTYVDGANALQIGFADPAEVADPVEYAAPPRYKPVVPSEPKPARQKPALPAEPKPARGRTPAKTRGAQPATTPRPTADPVARPAAAPLPVSLPRAPFLVLIVALVVAGVLGILVLNTKINENAFELDNLRAQQGTLNLQEQQLSQQLADKESTGNLAAEAARLGLVPAGQPAFLNLPNGKVLGVPQPAAPTGQTLAGSSEPGR
jgi:hypothetical protein